MVPGASPLAPPRPLPGQDAERARRHLERLACRSGRPTRPGPFPADGCWPRWAATRRSQDARLRFVLLRRIGDAYLSADVPEAAVREVLADT